MRNQNFSEWSLKNRQFNVSPPSDIFGEPETQTVFPAKQTGRCASCQKTISFADDFPQAVGACRSCLKIYTAVDAQLMQYAREKSQSWLNKLGGNSDI